MHHRTALSPHNRTMHRALIASAVLLIHCPLLPADVDPQRTCQIPVAAPPAADVSAKPSSSGTIEDMIRYQSVVTEEETQLTITHSVKNISEIKVSFSWIPVGLRVRYGTGLSAGLTAKISNHHPPGDWIIDYGATITLDQATTDEPHDAPAIVPLAEGICGMRLQFNEGEDILFQATVLYDPTADKLILKYDTTDNYRIGIPIDHSGIARDSILQGLGLTDYDIATAAGLPELSAWSDLSMVPDEGGLHADQQWIIPTGDGDGYIAVQWPEDDSIVFPMTVFEHNGVAALIEIPIDVRGVRNPSGRIFGQSPSPALDTVLSNIRTAPSLDVLESYGELPPLAQRLPTNPLVVKGLDGEYGGTLHRAWPRPDGNDAQRLIAEGLIDFSPSGASFVPGIASGYSVNQDARVYTFVLREGLKWSDGAGFDAKDVKWLYDHVLLNPEIYPDPLPWLVVNDQPVALEVVDDVTLRFSFAGTYSTFPEYVARLHGRDIIQPAHYLKQFHPEFTSESDLVQQLRQSGFEKWQDALLFYAGRDGILTPAAPSLNAWVTSDESGSDSSLLVMERNPYFWQVDSEGQQLPYVDRLVFESVDDTNGVLANALSGQIDFQFRHFDRGDLEVLFDEKPEGFQAFGYWQADGPVAGIVSGDLLNLPGDAVYHDFFGSPRNFRPQQFSFGGDSE